jgi:hypothetical protein
MNGNFCFNLCKQYALLSMGQDPHISSSMVFGTHQADTGRGLFPFLFLFFAVLGIDLKA